MASAMAQRCHSAGSAGSAVPSASPRRIVSTCSRTSRYRSARSAAVSAMTVSRVAISHCSAAASAIMPPLRRQSHAPPMMANGALAVPNSSATNPAALCRSTSPVSTRAVRTMSALSASTAASSRIDRRRSSSTAISPTVVHAQLMFSCSPAGQLAARAAPVARFTAMSGQAVRASRLPRSSRTAPAAMSSS
ncbi:hypothetical protein ACH35V_05395 [Actinomadura sp. 1N219]|uniref:hypothetical protein n=1 Tax=Actinomadura sp. 1N219 TaxID=3375152 RepID=UPI0037BA07FF